MSQPPPASTWGQPSTSRKKARACSGSSAYTRVGTAVIMPRIVRLTLCVHWSHNGGSASRRCFPRVAEVLMPTAATAFAPRQEELELNLPPTFDSLEDERQHRKQRLAGALRIFGRLGFGEGVA